MKKNNKLILSIQDLSCLGNCSLTVALPILSVCKQELVILPTALLSNHTGFKTYSILNLKDEMIKILKVWKEHNIKFDIIYTGYLFDASYILLIKEIKEEFLKKDGLFIVDPVMGDHGKLYKGFNKDYVEKNIELCKLADIILPNITEASFLAGNTYTKVQIKEEIEKIIDTLDKKGMKDIIIKSLKLKENIISIAFSKKNIKREETKYFDFSKINKNFSGTGDCFASAFIGRLCLNDSYEEAIIRSANFVKEAIINTDEKHFYGINFEKVLSTLI